MTKDTINHALNKYLVTFCDDVSIEVDASSEYEICIMYRNVKSIKSL